MPKSNCASARAVTGAPTGKGGEPLICCANPLADIANTRRIAAVVADGRYLSRQGLDQLLERLKRLAAEK
ncbi:hypothetical protein [Hymenobacter sp. PAMC 26628]|uniref:hypothetical protein n=1 Tax=Hymenobacter sp. PAMC 26628 TaxID=1484118 RepID=UPI0012FF9003|nr:hypothetical protein [Hymenobacter sp. PAMC 26628]